MITTRINIYINLFYLGKFRSLEVLQEDGGLAEGSWKKYNRMVNIYSI